MSRAFVSALVTALLVTQAAPTEGASHPAPSPRPPARRFPAPPTVPLIRVEVSRDHVLVVQDVLLGRGDWTGGDLDAFAAFGAPGLPRAIDARLYTPSEDDEPPGPLTPFEAVSMERAYQRPLRARLLFGSSAMAGALLHVREAGFRRATEGGSARLRLRTLLDLPAPDVHTGREVVVRLGAHEGEPYALGQIEVTTDETRPWLTRAEAHLCGPGADPWPLAVRLRSSATAPWQTSSAPPAPVAPVLSVRHASDDLCVRFWTTKER